MTEPKPPEGCQDCDAYTAEHGCICPIPDPAAAVAEIRAYIAERGWPPGHPLASTPNSKIFAILERHGL